MTRVRPRAQAPQRRLLHPPARRVEPCARSGAGGDRHRRALRRARRDRALQVFRHRQLGQGRDGAQDDRRRPRPRARRRLRLLPLRRRLQPAEEPPAAMGAGRRRAGDDRAAEAAGHARTHPRRHRARRPQQLGPHPVLGLRADFDLAAPAAVRRPHHRWRSRPSAARTRSTRCATIWSTTRARPACWSPRSPRTTSSTSSPRRWRWSAPTAIASRPTAPSARACRIRASTAPSRASSTTTCASAARCRSNSPSTR